MTQRTTWRIEGMHCPRCDEAILRAVRGLEGIREPRADYRSGTLSALWEPEVLPEARLAGRIAAAGYTLAARKTGPNARLLIAIAVFLAAFCLFAFTPAQALLSAFPTARAGMSLGALFLVGLLTSLHCAAMCGGFNIAQSARAAQEGGGVWRATLLYNLGRTLSYTAVGALVGGLGSVLRLSAAAQAAVQIAAAALMLLMALNLLGTGARVVLLPAAWRPRLLRAGGRSSLYIGLVNGLMPCGPLQAMQLYALSTGSWALGALSMLCFALGTVPLMLGFGLVSGRLNRRFAAPMRLASALVVGVMAMSMLVTGLTLAGLSLRASGPKTEAVVAEEGVQVVESELEWRGYPDITVSAGAPVRWVIHAEKGRITGCNSEMVIPALDLRVPLAEGDNIVEFTVDEPGVIPYTCWMGMLRGSITVVEETP